MEQCGPADGPIFTCCKWHKPGCSAAPGAGVYHIRWPKSLRQLTRRATRTGPQCRTAETGMLAPGSTAAANTIQYRSDPSGIRFAPSAALFYTYLDKSRRICYLRGGNIGDGFHLARMRA